MLVLERGAAHATGSIDVPIRAAHGLMIELFEEFRDLLLDLADAGADFAVVGGHAVAFHGHPRATKDLFVLVRATAENAERVYRALSAFGAPLDAFDVKQEDFATYDGVLQIGVPPRRIDLLNRVAGVSFDEVVREGASFDLEGRTIRVIGRSALLANKRAAGRPQDLADIEALERLTKRPT